MNGPPGMPIQSLPAGWLKQITLTRERVDRLEKTLMDLTRRVKELESERHPSGLVAVTSTGPVQPIFIGKPSESEPPVKRGPGRPRKVQPT